MLAALSNASPASASSSDLALGANSIARSAGLNLLPLGSNIHVRGQIASGDGFIFSKSSIEQDKLYFEVEISSTSTGAENKITCGVSPRVPSAAEAAAAPLGGAGILEKIVTVDGCKAKDLISVTYDQANFPTLALYVNGIFHRDVSGMRGAQHFWVKMEGGCEVFFRFNDCVGKGKNPVFRSFDAWMVARSVI